MKNLKKIKVLDNLNGTIQDVAPFLLKYKSATHGTQIVSDSEPKVLRTFDDKITLRNILASQYLTIESMLDGTTFYVKKHANPSILTDANLMYSLDNGTTWTLYTMPAAGSTGSTITINNGQKLLLKGNNPEGFALAYRTTSAHSDRRYYFLGSGKAKLYGNIMSLLYNDDFIDKLNAPNNGSFGTLFLGNTSLYEVELMTPEFLDGNEPGFLIFCGCTNLKKLKLLNGNLGLRLLVGYCENLETLEIPNINDNAWDLSDAFVYCTKLKNIDISKWDISNAVYIDLMFWGCLELKSIGDLSRWDVSNVSNVSYMFLDCNNLEDIGTLENWNISNVTDTSYMFNECLKLLNVGDLSRWDVSKVTNTSSMFYHCYKLKYIGDLSSWDVSKVTNMSYMFKHCWNLNLELDVSSWDVSKVTTMDSTFDTCKSLKLKGFKNWNVSNLTNMHALFRRCTSIDPEEFDFSTWQPKTSADLSLMFANIEGGDDGTEQRPAGYLALSITRIKHLLQIPTGSNTDKMFKNCYKLTTINASNTISTSVSFAESPLDHSSCLVLLNALDSSNTGTLTLSSQSYNSLSTTEIAIGTNKGWAIAKA